MKVRTMPWIVVLVGVVILSLLLTTQAFAGSRVLKLTRVGNLVNVDDAAGRYQYEGGTVYDSAGAAIGKYIITRRVTFNGTSTYNTAFTTISLFFSIAGTAPPQNITIQGAHSFNNGRFYGSVSAASNRYTWLQGADAQTVYASDTVTHTLYLYWAGSNQLVIP
jgi:hypothetical protein